MQGLTEILFRRVYEKCFPQAIPLAVSPFISLTHNLLQSPEELSKNGKLADILPSNNSDSIPVIPQILGKEPDEFIAVANCLYEMGYQEVNWNIGCPMRQVTAKHRGSGILPHPEEVRHILNTIIPNLKPALSVKMRIGLRDKSEIFNIIPVLNDYPLASVTIHPRLGRQQYTGIPDLEIYGLALQQLRHPVIYNGDIRTPADVHNILSRFPETSNIMIGRGILYNPSLPLEIKNETHNSQFSIHNHNSQFIKCLLQEIFSYYSADESRIRKIKEYWCLLWHSLSITESEARQVLRLQSLTDVDKKIQTFLQ